MLFRSRQQAVRPFSRSPRWVELNERRRDKDVIGILEDIAEESLESTNFFHSGPEPNWYALNPEAECV